MPHTKSKRSKLIKEAADSVTLHGLPRAITSEGRIVKTFWLIVFLCSLTVLVFFIYQRVTDYYKYEIYIKTQTKIIQPMKFPAVTICNSDRLNNSEGKPQPAFSMKNMTCNNSSVDFVSLSREETEFHKACKLFLSGSSDTFRFGGEAVSGFPELFKTTSGVYPCFTFNKDGKLKQSVGGSGKGVEMILYSDPIDSLKFDLANLSRFDDRRRGILVVIHDPETGLSLDLPSNIALVTGESTEIVLRQKVYFRKPAPFPSKCHTKDTTLYKVIPGRYTTSNCVSSCFQIKLKKKCGKQVYGDDIKSQVVCKKEMYKKYPIEDCVCPPPCTEIKYNRETSRSVWPQEVHVDSSRDSFAQMMNRTLGDITPYKLQQRLIQLKIYYQDLVIEEATEEELYGVSNLLSEVGGLMGLFIGASLISIVELAWFPLRLLRLLTSRSRSEPISDDTAASMASPYPLVKMRSLET